MTKDDKAQQMIEGTSDKPTPRVTRAAKKYAAALAEWQANQIVADTARSKLIDVMREDGVEHFVIAGEHEITLKKIEESYKIKVKSLEADGDEE